MPTRLFSRYQLKVLGKDGSPLASAPVAFDQKSTLYINNGDGKAPSVYQKTDVGVLRPPALPTGLNQTTTITAFFWVDNGALTYDIGPKSTEVLTTIGFAGGTPILAANNLPYPSYPLRWEGGTFSLDFVDPPSKPTDSTTVQVLGSLDAAGALALRQARTLVRSGRNPDDTATTFEGAFVVDGIPLRKGGAAGAAFPADLQALGIPDLKTMWDQYDFVFFLSGPALQKRISGVKSDFSPESAPYRKVFRGVAWEKAGQRVFVFVGFRKPGALGP